MTATPGASKRLATAGNSEDGQVLGPKGTHKADALTTASQSRFGTTPSDTVSPSGDFNAGGMTMDLRGGTEVITMASYGTGDSFTITFQEADGTKVTTAALVKATNSAASDLQTAIRAALTGTDLTVVTGNDGGPYTITYNRFYQGRRFPKIVAVTCTGCTATVSRTKTPASRLGGGHLGESLFDGDGVGPGHSLDAPTLGTITVTDAVDEEQTLDLAASTDGGTFELQFRRGRSGSLAWNASRATVATAVQNMFDQCAGLTSADAPTVQKRGTNEVQTLTLSSWDGGDTIKLTYGGNESGAVTQASDATAGFQTAIDTVAALVHSDYTAGDIVVTRTDATHYVFTFSGKSVSGTNVGAITATNGTGSATGSVAETTPGVFDGYKFTFENGQLAGMPIRGGIRIFRDGFTASSVAAPASISATTAGVLGSASAAYTELATYGDSVLAVAVSDTTGKEYGSGTGGAAVLDAASPVVIGSLPVGTYTLVARTYNAASQRSGPVATKAFTVSHA
jgi:hypothetical protein